MIEDYTDLAITQDGDLLLGPPLLGDQGEPIPDENGNDIIDLDIVYNESGLSQAIEFRLKTELGDLYLHPQIGSNLYQLIGRKNIREIAEAGKEMIITALTYDRLISKESLSIIPIPLDIDEIIYHIQVVMDGSVVYNQNFNFNIEEGIRRV